MEQDSLLARVNESIRLLRGTLNSRSSRDAVSEQLIVFLNAVLPSRFKATRATITDATGRATTEFLAVVFDTQQFDGKGASVPANAAAVVFEGSARLDVEVLRNAYEAIAIAKTLDKAQPAKTAAGFSPSNITLGVILSVDSAEPLETLALELDRQNRNHPFRQRPELLVVIERGTANFAMQWSGENISADFLAPAQGDFTLVAAYIHLVVRPGGQWSLARFAWYLLGHTWTWTGEVEGNQEELAHSLPKIALTICSYQFNLSRELVALRDEEYITSRFSGSVPVRIESPRGDVLGHVRFLPWQDGGAIQLKGKFPLQGLLIYLGNKEWLTAVRTESAQFSNVLPITINEFNVMVSRLQKQSNLVVRAEKSPSWVVSKFADEGSSTPFYARLFLGLTHLRDQALDLGQERKDFDIRYEVVINALESARSAMKEITTAVRDHAARLKNNQIVSFRGNQVTIDENIDRSLRREIETFLNSSVRAIKDGLHAVLAGLNVDIGFLFQKQAAFERGLTKLRAKDAVLADYLEETRRSWSAQLVLKRNDLHGSWVLPKPQYSPDFTNQIVEMVEPDVDGVPVSIFASNMFDRIACFTEELVTFALCKKLPDFICLAEIPVNERKPVLPQRFRLAVKGGGANEWQLAFRVAPFDNR